MISIGITTFRRREPLLSKLLRDLRGITDVPISVMVNADYGVPLDTGYVKRVLGMCAGYDEVYPTVFPTFTSLSKMWNTIILNSPTERTLVLNDDLEVTSDFISGIPSKGDLYVINGSWAHFVISKRMAIALNFFDERLLAFGEEDGDMVWKFETTFGCHVPVIHLGGVRNIGEGYRDPNNGLKLLDVDGHVFRPAFNREFLFERMYKPGGDVSGMFGSPHVKALEDFVQYPYEQFKRDNYDSL